MAPYSTKSIFRFAFLPFILVTIGFAGNGSIRGSVIDESTGLPLLGANVIIKGTDLGNATGLDGSFVLTGVSPSEVVLVVSMIGYGTERRSCVVRSGGSTEISFVLKPIILEVGQNVTVIGKSFEGATLDQYRNANLTTTEDMISRLEGINLIRRGNFAQEPIFRGLSGGQVNITIDGMKCFGACTDRMDPVSAYIEVDALNSIEMGKGALSLENGATIGGSLNMTHSRPKLTASPEVNWFVRGETQSAIKGQKVALRWSRSKPDRGIIINTTYRRADDYIDASGRVVPFTKYEKLNYILGLLTRLSSQTEFYLDFIGDDAFDVGYSALPMDVGYAQMRLLGLSLVSVGIKAWLPRMETKIYGNYINHWMDDSKRDSLFMNMTMDMPGFTRTVGAYWDIVVIPGAGQMLQLRTEFFGNTHYAEMVMHPEGSVPMKIITWPDVLRWNAGQYVEYQLALNTKATFKLAGRYDVFWSRVNDETGRNELQIDFPDDPLQRTDQLLTGNLFLDYRINRNWQTTIALALGQRIPTVTEMYGYYLYGVIDGYMYQGDPGIRPEKSRQFEWRNRHETDSFDLGVNLYRYNLNDYIFGEVNQFAPVVNYAKGWKYYRNVGKAYIQGLEMSVLSELDWHWSVFGGMSYEQGRLVGINDNLPMIPPIEIHGAVKYKRYPYWLQFEGKWCSKQEYYSRSGGENSTTAYMVLGLRGEYILQDGITINTGIDNLTNVDYHDHLDWADVPRPGRNYYLSLNIDKSILNK